MTGDYFLAPEHLELRGEAKAVTSSFLGRAPENDRAGRFPTENFADLRAAGMLALTVPSEVGGRGESFPGFQVVAERVAMGDASTCLCFGMHCAGVGMAISGEDEEQRKRYASLAAVDGMIFTIGFTEPGAGSHFLAPQAVAERVPGGYRLTGRKAFATSAGAAPESARIGAEGAGVGIAQRPSCVPLGLARGEGVLQPLGL